jgi:arylsulfatase A-like enzyme
MQPNVLLVVLDAARRDAVAPYRPNAPTPTIADLARRGRAVPSAYATSSWTLPSHSSMFTGLLPQTIGLGQAPDNVPGGARAVLARHTERLLPQALGGAGYATHGFSANLWASAHSGFDIGFDSFAYEPGGRAERTRGLTGTGPAARAAWALEAVRAGGDDGAAAIGRSLREQIARWSGQPTFWFVNLVECHAPYLPPRPWDDLPAAERIRAAHDSQRYMSFESICRHAAGVQQIPAESLERMRHLYTRSVAYMDDWLAQILAALDARGILEETLVIVTSDHGESFDEAGLIAHGFAVDERLINVPLVMAGPGAVAADTFTLRALPALIGAAAGVAGEPWASPAQPDGVAVAQYEAIAAPDNPRIVEFARRWGIDAAGVARLTAGYTCATDGRHKLVRSAGAERRFDLIADPEERAPLPAGTGEPAEIAALRAALDASEAETDPAGALAPDEARPTASAEEMAQLEQQMKLLGYM